MRFWKINSDFSKKRKITDNDDDKNNDASILGEKTKIDKLIFMDHVSGLADKSNEFQIS